MNKRLRELRLHRAELLARISIQREQIAEFNRRYHGPLMLADKGWSLVRFVYHRPLLIGLLSMLLVARRHGVVGLARAGWKVWKSYRLFRGMAAKLAPSKDSVQRA